MKSPLGIFIGQSADTANSSKDQIGPIPPNGPRGKEVKPRLSASFETINDNCPAQLANRRGLIQDRISLTLLNERL